MQLSTAYLLHRQYMHTVYRLEIPVSKAANISSGANVARTAYTSRNTMTAARLGDRLAVARPQYSLVAAST